MALHRSFEKLQRCPAIPALGGESFECLAFVIHGAPQVMRFTVDPDEHFVQVPTPSGIRLMLVDTSLPDIRGEHWTKPVPPEPHGFVANIDATLEQKIFDLAQRERITDVHHHREANYPR